MHSRTKHIQVSHDNGCDKTTAAVTNVVKVDLTTHALANAHCT